LTVFPKPHETRNSRRCNIGAMARKSAQDDLKDKLILKLIFEMDCRVGEFCKIRLKHINFDDCSVLFPAENAKTKDGRPASSQRT
jgi:integrase